VKKSDEIMPEIEKFLLDFEHPLKEVTNAEISEIYELIKRALRLLDILFSILRKSYGEVTDDDIVTYKNTVEKAALLWQKIDLSYPPSFHYLHREALRLLQLHGGFGE
jgi:hypothetical protein